MALSKDKSSIDEVVTCPICCFLPEAAVYQCINGHTICESCLNNLPNEFKERTVGDYTGVETVKKCPTCRVTYGTSMIRNRTAEGILDILLCKCPYEECAKRVLSEQLEAHKSICDYRPFEICRVLWNENCTFTSNNPTDIIKHVKSAHNNRLTFLPVDSTTTKVTYFLDKVLSCSVARKPKSIKDIAIDTGNGWIILRQVITPAKGDYLGDISWVGLALTKTPSDIRRFGVTAKVSNDPETRWKWKGKPFFYKDATEVVKEPALSVKFGYLKKCLRSGNTDVNLTVDVEIGFGNWDKIAAEVDLFPPPVTAIYYHFSTVGEQPQNRIEVEEEGVRRIVFGAPSRGNASPQ